MGKLLSSAHKSLKGIPVSAKCVLMCKDGRVLSLRKSSGLYDMPGGKVEKKEDLFDALSREIFEETRLKVRKFEFVSSWVKQQGNLSPRLVMVFRAKLKKSHKDISLKLSDEHDWGEFLTPKKALKLPMQAGYKHAIAMSTQRKLSL